MIVAVIETTMKKIPKRRQDCKFYGHQDLGGWCGDPCCDAMNRRKVKAKDRPEWCPLVEIEE